LKTQTHEHIFTDISHSFDLSQQEKFSDAEKRSLFQKQSTSLGLLQCAMTQQQCQLTNSRISTLELCNKQTNKQISEYIYSRVLRSSDVINDFVFKDKNLERKAKDFVIKTKAS